MSAAFELTLNGKPVRVEAVSLRVIADYSPSS